MSTRRRTPSANPARGYSTTVLPTDGSVVIGDIDAYLSELASVPWWELAPGPGEPVWVEDELHHGTDAYLYGVDGA